MRTAPLLLLLVSAGLLPACNRADGKPDSGAPDDTDTDSADTDSGSDTDSGNTDSGDPQDSGASDGWNGRGAYRVVLTVPGYDPGPDGVDEGPARVDLDLDGALARLGVDGAPDLATLQVIREDAAGNPLSPSRGSSSPRGRYDVPYRLADHDLWSEGYAYNFAVTGSDVELTFTHRQQGAGDTRYAVYFDRLGDGADGAVVSPRPALGDMDMRHRETGYLASMIHSRPQLVDLDGDGLLDLAMGDSLGRMTVYLNEGTPAAPVWQAQQVLRADGRAIQKNFLAAPEVVDWDGDGDLDLLVGSEYGAIVTFYANTGGAGVPTFEDRGTLTADGAELRLPYDPVPEAPFYTQDYTASPEAVDWDGDGDLDLLLGGYVTGRIYLYLRDGDALAYAGPIAADGAPIDTSWSASPSLVDLDDDGDLDLLSGTFNWEMTAEEAAAWPPFFAWRNTAGPGAEPVFTAWTLPLRGGDVLAAGTLSFLAPGDVDDDGDADLVVTAEGYAWIFRNVGTAADPLFEQESPLTQPMTPLPTGTDGQAVDVDGDGDLDLVQGGNLYVGWVENEGGADPVSWTPHAEGLTSNGATILYYFEGGDDTAFPVLEDWEDDGDLDLLVGTAEGWVDLYRSAGGVPDDGFGSAERLRLTDGSLLQVGEQMDPEDSFEGHSGNRAQPTSADLDGDGDRDLVVGDALGGVTRFVNEGSDADPVFAPGETLLAHPGERMAPSLADWDDDGDVDLLLGRPGQADILPNVGDRFDLRLGDAVTIDDPTVYYPHPYAADWNGDGDLDLSVSSSYGYTYLAERTWLERGWLEATAVSIDDRDGTSVDVVREETIGWAYEADALPSMSDPEWWTWGTGEGSVSGGVLTLASEQSIGIGTLFDAGGDAAWPGTDGTEVELRMRVRALADGQTDTISVSLSDGANSWHVRLNPAGLSFYSYPDVYAADTTGWHVWRVAIDGDLLRVCADDDPARVWDSPPSFAYTRRALWIGDDGTGTGGTTEIDYVRWVDDGDGDPCTGW